MTPDNETPVAVSGRAREAVRRALGSVPMDEPFQVDRLTDAIMAALAGGERYPPTCECELVAFGASDAACYQYPGEDQLTERAAFCSGAAFAVCKCGNDGTAHHDISCPACLLEDVTRPEILAGHGGEGLGRVEITSDDPRYKELTLRASPETLARIEREFGANAVAAADARGMLVGASTPKVPDPVAESVELKACRSNNFILQTTMQKLVDALVQIRDHEAAELNLSNYGTDDVAALNQAWIEVHFLARNVLASKDGQQ